MKISVYVVYYKVTVDFKKYILEKYFFLYPYFVSCVLLGRLEVGLHIEKDIDLGKCMDYCLVLCLKYVPYA